MGELPHIIPEFARAIAKAGGRALLVGGCVRDRFLGADSEDHDLEVFGLDLDTLESTLAAFGKVITVGRSFGVLMVQGHEIDFSVPRQDNKIGRTHKDFRCEFDPNMSFEEAARRRDLTINSMGLDPLTEELFDPHGGQGDLREKRLRATDVQTFPEDPLRALRVAQFLARFEFEPDAELHTLCSQSDLLELPGERLWGELKKLLLLSPRPSLGLDFLRTTDLLRFFPELKSMVGVPQDATWHPEGPVWDHTLMVVDEAAKLRTDDEQEDLLLMYGALCHDLGKPLTTFTDEEGRVRSPNHSDKGVPPTESFLERLRAPHQFVDRVCALVRHHLAPALLTQPEVTPRAYRRLARRLGEAGVSMLQLERVARADHLGRTTPEALAREYAAGPKFLAESARLQIEMEPEPAVVQGRHLLERGLQAGPHFALILERCREIQEETGSRTPGVVLTRYEADFGALQDTPG
ncbi:MAG: tRNA nucleotidyltransferase (CCA-adding enzyme) [Candidatus Paceibacteria bacterium]|jgi:tRNA nucleotidyltransferase (CCA-adding enzyme)